MNTPLTTHRNLVTLVQVLRKLERSRVPVDPEQYRSLVTHIADELRNHPRDAGLEALLTAVPELAELYENLQYEHAGLCRSPLDAAVGAEQAARDAIAAAMRR
ncbi:MAG TPA: hypothetical protein VFE82_03745 [Ramlibacter sp.]|jgi:hypothetical protein|uniref:hypothetical protein n=1 Tax=Ramlibacter sp. TaxID=1917967 RepID=UPI002D5EDA3F|nr:hypothetical protein [Ramlibacter sp.]HZY17566.1 hypothetical protein [Ramlibacter sp.]